MAEKDKYYVVDSKTKEEITGPFEHEWEAQDSLEDLISRKAIDNLCVVKGDEVVSESLTKMGKILQRIAENNVSRLDSILNSIEESKYSDLEVHKSDALNMIGELKKEMIKAQFDRAEVNKVVGDLINSKDESEVPSKIKALGVKIVESKEADYDESHPINEMAFISGSLPKYYSDYFRLLSVLKNLVESDKIEIDEIGGLTDIKVVRSQNKLTDQQGDEFRIQLKDKKYSVYTPRSDIALNKITKLTVDQVISELESWLKQ